jgi:hypothetical protein
MLIQDQAMSRNGEPIQVKNVWVDNKTAGLCKDCAGAFARQNKNHQSLGKYQMSI